MRTIEQRRANDALKRVKDVNGKPEDFRKLYRSYVDRLGPAIVMNGLGQALATEIAAAGPKRDNSRKQAHHALYKNVQGWLCGAEGVYRLADDLMSAITDNDEASYLRAQAETLAWLEWHKKFCRAYLPAEDSRTE